MTGVIYARFSSHAQREESIEGQLRVCHQYAKDHDINIIREYCDSAKTGRNDLRAEFQQMLKDADQKKFDCVLIYTRDRFARNKYDDAVNKHRLKKNGISLISVTQNISDDEPEGVLMESVLVGLAEYYSLDLSRKVKRGMKDNALKGKSNGGVTPIGYKLIDGKYEIDPDYAPIVRNIFRWYADGMTQTEITNKLNNSGYRTPKGGKFKKGSIHNILQNRKYTGTYIHNGVVIDGGMPQIVTKELFDEVLSRQKKFTGGQYRAKHDYLLSGKIFCCDDHKMYGESAKGKMGKIYTYYRCECRRIKKDDIEQFVVDAAVNLFMNDATVHSIAVKSAESVNRNEEREMLQKSLSRTNLQISNLIQALSFGPSEAVLAKIQALEEEKTQLQEELERQPKEIKVDDIELYLKYVMTNHDENYSKRIIDTLVYKVIVHDEYVTIIFNVSDEEGDPTIIEEYLKELDAEGFEHGTEWSTIIDVYELFILVRVRIR